MPVKVMLRLHRGSLGTDAQLGLIQLAGISSSSLLDLQINNLLASHTYRFPNCS